MELKEKLGGPAEVATTRVPLVSTADVEAVVSAWSGVPVEQMSSDEMKRLRELQDSLKVCIPPALTKISSKIRLPVSSPTVAVHCVYHALQAHLQVLKPLLRASCLVNQLSTGLSPLKCACRCVCPEQEWVPTQCLNMQAGFIDSCTEFNHMNTICCCAGARDWSGRGGDSSVLSLEASTHWAEGPQSPHCSAHVLRAHWCWQDRAY